MSLAKEVLGKVRPNSTHTQPQVDEAVKDILVNLLTSVVKNMKKAPSSGWEYHKTLENAESALDWAKKL